MRNKLQTSTDGFKAFWQPLIITYAITVILIVATCIVVHQCFYLNISSYSFYEISLNSYLVYLLAKVAETLVPTTITFSLLLMLTTNGSSDKTKTFLVVLVVLLSVFGIIKPTVSTMLGFWVILVLIYVTIMIAIFETANLFNVLVPDEYVGHKAEPSDGKLSR